MRYCFLVDRITEFVSGQKARGIKNITLTEDFLATHFPNAPIMPGVLITEAQAQLARWLIVASRDFTCRAELRSLRDVKFRKYVQPGDQMELTAEVVRAGEDTAVVKTSARLEGKVISTVREMTLTLVKASPEESQALRAHFALCDGTPEHRDTISR